MEYEEMKALQRTHVCAQCESHLNLVWDPEQNMDLLVCAKDHAHQGIKRLPTTQQLLKQGRADEIAGSGAQTDLERRARENQLAFDMLPKRDLGDRRELTLSHAEALIEFADSIGLNARLGHVCLYHGEPYPTIDGYYYLNGKRSSPYRIGARPMTKEERLSYMIAEKDFAWIAEAWLESTKLAEVGIGIASDWELNERSKNNPDQFRSPVVHDHPQRMAEKRAEWQLLRKLIPLEATV